MIDILITLVAYNTPKEELSSLVSELKKTKLRIKIYIIDNSLTDKLRCLTDESVNYIHNNKNMGFGAAHNIIIKEMLGKSKYNLILNPDIILKADVLDNLFEYMEIHSDIGNIMPDILYLDGNRQYLCKLLPTFFELIFRSFLISKNILKIINNKYELRFANYSVPFECPSLSGCFMFIRNSVFKDIGYFDERYFLYLEDLDLCRRINSKYKTIFYPYVKIYHGYHKGSYKNFKLLKYHILSAIKYFNKWGWFFDNERRYINKNTLKKLGYYK